MAKRTRKQVNLSSDTAKVATQVVKAPVTPKAREVSAANLGSKFKPPTSDKLTELPDALKVKGSTVDWNEKLTTPWVDDELEEQAAQLAAEDEAGTAQPGTEPPPEQAGSEEPASDQPQQQDEVAPAAAGEQPQQAKSEQEEEEPPPFTLDDLRGNKVRLKVLGEEKIVDLGDLARDYGRTEALTRKEQQIADLRRQLEANLAALSTRSVQGVTAPAVGPAVPPVASAPDATAPAPLPSYTELVDSLGEPAAKAIYAAEARSRALENQTRQLQTQLETLQSQVAPVYGETRFQQVAREMASAGYPDFADKKQAILDYLLQVGARDPAKARAWDNEDGWKLIYHYLRATSDGGGSSGDDGRPEPAGKPRVRIMPRKTDSPAIRVEGSANRQDDADRRARTAELYARARKGDQAAIDQILTAVIEQKFFGKEEQT